MESVQKSWRSSIRERILLLKKNSNTNLFANNPEAIDYAPVAKENSDSLNLPIKDGQRSELPLRLAIEAYHKDKNDTDAMILIQLLLSSGANADKKSSDNLSPFEYATLHNVQEIIDAIETHRE